LNEAFNILDKDHFGKESPNELEKGVEAMAPLILHPGSTVLRPLSGL
jgi:hypothetical protein